MGITSIWDNSFYDNNSMPQPKWAFEVIFTQYQGLHEADRELLTKAVMSTSIKPRELTVTPTYYGGVGFQHATRAKTEDQLEITFADNNQMRIYSILNTLFNYQSFNSNWPMVTGKDDSTSGYFYRRTTNTDKANSPWNKIYNNIVVRLLQPHNFIYTVNTAEQPSYSVEYVFHNCQIISIGEIDLSYDAEEAVELNAAFAYDWMEPVFYKGEEK